MQTRLDITDPEAAAVFAAARQRRIVMALIEQDRSLTELSRSTSMPLNLLHHHIAKLLRLRLVVVTDEVARRGRPIKRYRSVAQSFFVPASLMDLGQGIGLMSNLRDELEAIAMEALEGVVHSVEATGPRIRLVKRKEPKRVALELWLNLRLSRADALDLANALRGMVETYESRANRTGRRHILHVAFAST